MASTELVLNMRRPNSKQRPISILKKTGARRESNASKPLQGVNFSNIQSIGPKPSKKKTSTWIAKRTKHDKVKAGAVSASIQDDPKTSRMTAVLNDLRRSGDWLAASGSQRWLMEQLAVAKLVGRAKLARVAEFVQRKPKYATKKSFSVLEEWLAGVEEVGGGADPLK